MEGKKGKERTFAAGIRAVLKYLEGHFVKKKKRKKSLSVEHKGQNQDNKLMLPQKYISGQFKKGFSNNVRSKKI